MPLFNFEKVCYYEKYSDGLWRCIMEKILCATIVMIGLHGVADGMEQHKQYTIVPRLEIVSNISTDNITTDDNSLSPRSMYDKGLRLISSSDPSVASYGALLILKSARARCSTALDHFSLTCNIQKIEKYSDTELLQFLIEAASRPDF